MLHYIHYIGPLSADTKQFELIGGFGIYLLVVALIMVGTLGVYLLYSIANNSLAKKLGFLKGLGPTKRKAF